MEIQAERNGAAGTRKRRKEGWRADGFGIKVRSFTKQCLLDQVLCSPGELEGPKGQLSLLP